MVTFERLDLLIRGIYSILMICLCFHINWKMSLWLYYPSAFQTVLKWTDKLKKNRLQRYQLPWATSFGPLSTTWAMCGLLAHFCCASVPPSRILHPGEVMLLLYWFIQECKSEMFEEAEWDKKACEHHRKTYKTAWTKSKRRNLIKSWEEK